MNWKIIDSEATLDALNTRSQELKIILFKHSTRCSISAMALDRLERSWKEADTKNIEFYYLDLIAFRELSIKIAQRYGVVHESPQALVIHKGRCVFDASHTDISYAALIA